MATWEEVRRAVRERFQLDLDDPHEFGLTLPRQAGAAREQRIMVRHYVAWEREMIEFRSAFGELDEVDLAAALRAVLHQPLGGIALHGRFLVVVHRAGLAELSIDGVLFLLAHVSLVADQLEEERGDDRF